MNTIIRHTADEVNYAKESEVFQDSYLSGKLLNRPVNMLENINTWNLKSISNSFYSGFYTACYLSETAWAKTFWDKGNDLLRLIFDLGLSGGKEIMVDYNGEQKVINSGAVPSLETVIYNHWDWIQWVQYALIARDEKQIINLEQINTQTMFAKIAEQGRLNPDLIDKDLHSFHFLLLKKEYEKASVVVKDIIEKITDKPEVYYKNYLAFNWKKKNVDLLVLPYYQCLESILEANQTQFDERLNEGLQKHKEWAMLKPIKGHIPNSNNYFGFVSIRMLTACCLASDNGMMMNIISDYIPEWLINKPAQKL